MDGMAANGNAQAQVAAGSVLAWMIQHGSITLDQALSDMLSFLNSGSLAPANAIGLLVGMAAAGNQSLQYTVGVELVQLILDGNVTAQQAASDFGAAVKSGQLSANNAVTVLVGMYLMGMDEGDNSAVQGAAAGEIAQLIASGAIDPPQAFGVINNLITATISPAPTVFDVINLYASMAANGNASVQATAGGGIAQLIENGSTNAPDALDSIDDLVSEGAIATANAVALFAAIASAGNAPLQVAAGYQIGQMIEDSTITSQQAFGDISSLVNAGSLAPGNAVGLLEGVAVAGNQSLQIAAGGEIATLVNAGQLTKQQAQTDIANAVGAGLMTAAQAQAILQGLG